MVPDTLPREADSVTEVQPVILQSLTEKKLTTYNPTAIDRCLNKCAGVYRFCTPLKNGNLIVKVETTLQVKGLLTLAFLSDGSGVFIPILASLFQPANAKGVIYRIPVDLSADELKASLNSQNVSCVKIFNFKDYEGNMRTPLQCCYNLLNPRFQRKWVQGTYNSKSSNTSLSLYAVSNATDTGMWLITVKAKKDAPIVAVPTVGRIMIPMTKDARTVNATILLPIQRFRFISVNQK